MSQAYWEVISASDIARVIAPANPAKQIIYSYVTIAGSGSSVSDTSNVYGLVSIMTLLSIVRIPLLYCVDKILCF